jgi:cell division protein FtsQ
MKQALALPLDIRLMNLTSRALWLILLLMGMSGFAGWLVQHPVFALRSISVQGDTSHSNGRTLRTLLAPALSGTYLTIDLAATRAAFEQVPWVRRAEVRREFPNRLKVILQEHQAVAFWGSEGDSTLVNSYGEVFEANPGELDDDGLFRLNGPKEQSAQVLSLYRALQPMFEGRELSIEQLELTGRGNWRAQLQTGAEIELGRGSEEELIVRTRQFIDTIQQVTARYERTPGALETADLRHEQGYAVRLKGVSTVTTAVAGSKK